MDHAFRPIAAESFTAADFAPGDRVAMSDFGVRNGLDGPRRWRTGTVVRIGRDGRLFVRRDGAKTAQYYGAVVWWPWRHAEALRLAAHLGEGPGP